MVLAELDYLVRSRLGVDAARILADDGAAGAYDLAPLSARDVADCVALDRAYGELGLGLTDALLVVLAARIIGNDLPEHSPRRPWSEAEVVLQNNRLRQQRRLRVRLLSSATTRQ